MRVGVTSSTEYAFEGNERVQHRLLSVLGTYMEALL